MNFDFLTRLFRRTPPNSLAAVAARLDVFIRKLNHMTDQADKLNARADALITQNTALIGLAHGLKASLDAAVANGAGMTADEVQALSDKLDAATAADAAEISADTPLPPATSGATAAS